MKHPIILYGHVTSPYDMDLYGHASLGLESLDQPHRFLELIQDLKAVLTF